VDVGQHRTWIAIDAIADAASASAPADELIALPHLRDQLGRRYLVGTAPVEVEGILQTRFAAAHARRRRLLHAVTEQDQPAAPGAGAQHPRVLRADAARMHA